MESSSANSDNISGTRAWHPSCAHGDCHLHTSYSLQNPGRRFWCCPIWKEPNTCGFFTWYEEPYEGQVRRLLLHLINKHNNVRAMLETKEREKREFKDETERLEEECRLKDARLLKLKNEKILLKQRLQRTRAVVGGIAVAAIAVVLFSEWFRRYEVDTERITNFNPFYALK